MSEELQLVFDRGLEHEKRYLEELRSVGQVDRRDRDRLRRRRPSSRRGADGRGDAQRRRRRLPGHLLRRRLGRAGRLPAEGARRRRTSATGRTRSPTPSWPASSRSPHCCRWRPTPSGSTVLQGVAPQRIHVVTGDGVSRPWRLVDVAAYARRARTRLETFVAAPPATGPSPIGYCEQCRWAEKCNTDLRAADDLGLVAFMRGDHRDALFAAGITTLAALAHGDAGAAGGVRHRGRRPHPSAAAGSRAAEASAPPARSPALLLDPQPGLGLLRLPPPSPGDLYLDFEGDPWFEDGEGHRVPRRAREHDGRLHPALGARPRGREADGRRPHRPVGRGGAGRPGHARLPLRAVRGHRAEEADGRLRRPGGRAGPAAARGAVRRPLSRRPAVDADQQGVVLDQEGGGVLRPVARGRGRQRHGQRPDVRALARRPRPAEARRHRVLQQGRRRLDAGAPRVAGAAAGRARGACTARSRGRLPRDRAGTRGAGHRGDRRGARARPAAARRRAPVARRPRAVAPPGGPPGVVGGLPPDVAGPRGADPAQHGARRAVRRRSTAARRRRAGCTSTRSRSRTPGSRPATTSATPRPPSRWARSSSWTPRAGAWC